MRLLSYSWNNPVIGTNVLQVVFSNTTANVVIDTKSLIIAPPLQITSVSPDDQLIIWNSAPGADYEVLATTNLTEPFEPVSGIIPSQGTSTFFNDIANSPPRPKNSMKSRRFRPNDRSCGPVKNLENVDRNSNGGYIEPHKHAVV